jgi:hypothetical protein
MWEEDFGLGMNDPIRTTPDCAPARFAVIGLIPQRL